MTSVTERLSLLAEFLGVETASAVRRDLPELIEKRVGAPSHELSYLTIAVLESTIPDPTRIKRVTREWRTAGLGSVIRTELRRLRFARDSGAGLRIESGTVIDVTETVASAFTTGIQRVARETIAGWSANEGTPLLVRWDPRSGRFVTLDAARLASIAPQYSVAAEKPEVVIPFHANLLLPELAVDPRRVSRLRTIARYGGGRSTAIGFDCIPITSAETAAAGMPGAFSKYLSTLARFDVVAPISEAAATEYRGWRRMLAGAGLGGPRIEAVELPFTSTGTSDPKRAADVRAELGLTDKPIVLCVGSHEPRKNHLTVLYASELAWRAGHEFSLVLVGGNAWETERFDRLVGYLRRRDRHVLTLSGVSDDVIWDLYDSASFSLFPSLNEGFGLPVVESLGHGTPVITSNFGSMRSIGEGNGAVLVDPRDPQALADAMIDLLGDRQRLETLRNESRRMPASNWDDYSRSIQALAVHSAP
jgi:glycosyltransferase involved in cell wall biosynthesis